MNRQRGKIVAVGIVIMIVIVMLSGGWGGGNSLELVAVCWWGVGNNSVG